MLSNLFEIFTVAHRTDALLQAVFTSDVQAVKYFWTGPDGWLQREAQGVLDQDAEGYSSALQG